MTYTITPQLKRAYHLNYVAKPATQLKLRARARCAYAIKTGKLVRLPCEGCGEAKSEAHHDDYSKPLEVKWLCRSCHAAAHRKSHCAKGHLLTEQNIRAGPSGRQCLQCSRARDRERQKRNRENRNS